METNPNQGQNSTPVFLFIGFVIVLIVIASFFSPKTVKTSINKVTEIAPLAELSPQLKQWKIDNTKDDSSDVRVLSPGYHFLRAFKGQYGKGIVKDMIQWEWKATLRNMHPNKIYCVEFEYRLWDRGGFKIASSKTGIRLKPLETVQIQRIALMPYSKAFLVEKGNTLIRARYNFVTTPFCCSGEIFKESDESMTYTF